MLYEKTYFENCSGCLDQKHVHQSTVKYTSLTNASAKTSCFQLDNYCNPTRCDW